MENRRKVPTIDGRRRARHRKASGALSRQRKVRYLSQGTPEEGRREEEERGGEEEESERRGGREKRERKEERKQHHTDRGPTDGTYGRMQSGC